MAGRKAKATVLPRMATSWQFCSALAKPSASAWSLLYTAIDSESSPKTYFSGHTDKTSHTDAQPHADTHPVCTPKDHSSPNQADRLWHASPQPVDCLPGSGNTGAAPGRALQDAPHMALLQDARFALCQAAQPAQC